MIAAIYARKSTEQNGADADAKSRRTPDRERPRVCRNEGLDRPRCARLLRRRHQRRRDAASWSTGNGCSTSSQAGPPFRVLIMRDASRFSRRDGDEAFGELKRIAQAGVAIWFYQDGTRFEFGTFAANVIGFVQAEMNAEFDGRSPRGRTRRCCEKPRPDTSPAARCSATTTCTSMDTSSVGSMSRRRPSCGASSRSARQAPATRGSRSS